ncbi:VWA domain-containing protein [Propioniciclava coleopterorum]|uniref:VWA domain-containing protein n=1 Tax=Propioniciclava coleopterorum TaxID=2714937 RepID=UPI001981DF17|nr:VWA domain-containing protein [Propioniciclava coleopterorum]
MAEKIMDDAVNRHGLTEVVTNAETLAKATPNTGLLKAILSTKHLMNPEVLAMARTIVDKVVRDLMRSLARPITNPFTGRRDPRRRSRQHVAANFDARGTVRANLRHIDPATRRLVIREPLFNTRVRLQQDRWQVVVAVDQSGSMVNSVIHAAVTAAIFTGISAMRTHLIAFDTSVVDLTGQAADPVEVLMRVQLGGGTAINVAMEYAASLLNNPRRSIVVMISDFYEGGHDGPLIATTARLVQDGVRVLCLGALDADGRSMHNQVTAQSLAAVGAHVAVMTPTSSRPGSRR